MAWFRCDDCKSTAHGTDRSECSLCSGVLRPIKDAARVFRPDNQPYGTSTHSPVCPECLQRFRSEAGRNFHVEEGLCR